MGVRSIPVATLPSCQYMQNNAIIIASTEWETRYNKLLRVSDHNTPFGHNTDYDHDATGLGSDDSLWGSIKPIFHHIVNPFALGPGVSLDPQRVALDPK